MRPSSGGLATMEHYVGLDVSLRQTSICVVNQAGSVLREGVVNSDPDAIGAFVRSNAPDVVRIGLETGPTATWLWTELKQLGLPVICIDARHARAVLKMQINKSDRNDTAGIARIMQTGWFKEVRVKDLDSHSSERCWRAGRCWSRSSAISRTRSAACSRTSVSSSATSRGANRGSSRAGGRGPAAARGAQGYRAAGRQFRP